MNVYRGECGASAAGYGVMPRAARDLLLLCESKSRSLVAMLLGMTTSDGHLTAAISFVGRNWNASVYSAVRGVYCTPFFVAQMVNWKWIGMMPRSCMASSVARWSM